MAENRCNLKLLLAGVFSPVPADEQLLLFRAGAHLRANSKETLRQSLLVQYLSVLSEASGAVYLTLVYLVLGCLGIASRAPWCKSK